MGRSIRQFLLRYQVMFAALVLCFNSLPCHPPATAQEPIDQALFERLRWARFELVRGRLEVRDIRRGQNRSITVNHHEIMVREHIDFRINNNILLLHYERQSPDNVLTLNVHGKKLLTLRQTPSSSNQPSVLLHQDLHQVRLQLGEEDSRQYHAPHLWLLFLEHPRECQEHLVPLLQTLRQNWHLGHWIETVETNLIRSVLAPPTIDMDLLRKKIRELGSGPYRQRRAADIAIRAMGQEIIGILSEIDDRSLNAEQRLRIRRICESLSLPSADTPLSVTSWLQSSPSTWLCLMTHPDSAIRTSSHQRLAWLLGRPIPFNPEALPGIRERQIAGVRENLLQR
ncbi:MAG: hypothetical protein VYB09_01925 [Planctomycetota bacterium]|nr:hypothetical protein [Planctomycetota bacterium]